MAKSQIRSLDDSELEVLMDHRYHVTRRIRIHTRLLQKARFTRMAFQALLDIPPWEIDFTRYWAIFRSILCRLDTFNEALELLRVQEREDAETFGWVWGGDNM